MSKLIKIIKGVYGHKVNKVIVPKDKNSAAFEVSDDTASALIARGIAVEASTLKSQADKPIKYSESLALQKEKIVNKAEAGEEEQADAAEKTTEETEQAEYSMENTQKELLAMARELGFDGSDKETKANLIEFLDAATAASEDTPEISGEDGVVG